MFKEAIYHIQDLPYAFVSGPNELTVRLRTKKNDAKKICVIHRDRLVIEKQDQVLEMEKVGNDDLFDFFEGVINTKSKRIEYVFCLMGYEGKELWYGEDGISDNMMMAGIFECPHIFAKDMPENPKWIEDAVVYNILVDRFYNGNKKNDNPNTVPWGQKPTDDIFFGGDIEGVFEKLPYLVDLGINIIYFCPVYESPTPHKYYIKDFLSVDSEFGGTKLFKSLVEEAHSQGIKIILDGVFNHCGDQFFAFKDVQKKGKDSKYFDWFFIHELPLIKEPKPNYECYADFHVMPKLNLKNPELRQYMLDVARFWTEDMKIDGWRLDVVNEVDHAFWREFRKLVKSINKEVLIVGEAWHESGAWLRGDQLDSVTNYKVSMLIHQFFAWEELNAEGFMNGIIKNLMCYHNQANNAMLNFVSNHDALRIVTSCIEYNPKLSDEVKKFYIERSRLMIVFQFTFIGVPVIYYGDEIGMEGFIRPDCRRTMVWDENKWDKETLVLHKKLIKLRKTQSALKYGKFIPWIIDNEKKIIGYLRSDGEETIAIIINNSPLQQQIEVEVDWNVNDKYMINIIEGEQYEVKKKMTFSLPEYSFQILK